MTTLEARRVRRIAGPFVIRTCLRDDTGYHWTERLRRGTDGYLDAAGIGLVRELLGDVPGCVLPVPATPTLALWPGLASAELMSDRLLSGALPRETGQWRESLRRLGGIAGRIHAAPLTEQARRSLPDRTRAPAWLTPPDVVEGVREARGRQPRHLVPALAAAADAARRPARTTLVHGRFSAGTCTAEVPPRLLGWREAGLGDPLQDIACLVADLVETGSATRCPPAVLRTCVRAFLSGYPQHVDETSLWSAVARRIFDHYAVGAWATGDDTGVAELLPIAESNWLAVQEGTR